ncbi:MAG: endonuclease V [Methanomassiliicoccales archaeon]|nr:MAG: endonuclease V [Methanomassiliicoccales archaeon]
MRFRKELSAMVEQIPEGMVSTYGDIARAIGDVVASRTIYSLLQEEWDGGLPIHRVVTSRGEAALSRYLQMLKEEGVPVENRKVRNLKDHLFKDFKSERILAKLREKQEELASKVSLEDGFKRVRTVGGIDVAYKGDSAFAACVILDVEKMKLVEERRLSGKVTFPYVSTYLSYRELPMIKKIFKRLKTKPDVLMIDGNGILHPRRIGIASHAGLELNVPTIGVTKRLLLGKLGKTPKKIGDFSSIIHEGCVLGMALKSSKSDRYVFVSPGHMISMKSALDLSRKLCFHRIPEPTRRAHRMATELRNKRTG